MSALLETVRVWRGGVPLWPWHARRLAASAEVLGVALDLPGVEAALMAWCAAHHADAIVRVQVQPEGAFALAARPVPALRTFRIGISPVAVQPDDPHLQHKTTERVVYARAAAWAEAQGLDDALLLNTDGRVTESSIASVLVERDGRVWTPPVADGLLPGVMRRVLIEASCVAERSLSPHELHPPTRLWLCNAARGVWPAVLVET